MYSLWNVLFHHSYSTHKVLQIHVVKGVQSMHIYRYPEVDPEASKWLFKAPLWTVLPAVPVPVLQQMESINTWPKNPFCDSCCLYIKKATVSSLNILLIRWYDCCTFDLKPLIKDGNLQVCMYCRLVRKGASWAPRTYYRAFKISKFPRGVPPDPPSHINLSLGMKARNMYIMDTLPFTLIL